MQYASLPVATSTVHSVGIATFTQLNRLSPRFHTAYRDAPSARQPGAGNGNTGSPYAIRVAIDRPAGGCTAFLLFAATSCKCVYARVDTACERSAV
jgi:hypothetical protein